MNEYEIGRDYQELRARVEGLEKRNEQGMLSRSAVQGRTPDRVAATIDRKMEPLLWKAEKKTSFPPFVNRSMGLPSTHEFDVRPESKSWPAKDPLLLFITWAAGGQDEFYRYENQMCSIFKFTDPNTGAVTANATYSAQLRASGKAQSGFTYLVGRNTSVLVLTLHDASGGPLMTFQNQRYSIDCDTNYSINEYWPFNAGLYDLIAFPTWGVAGPQSVDRC
jgi:hypothetical protein